MISLFNTTSSSRPSASACAVTVTVCAVFQLLGVKDTVYTPGSNMLSVAVRTCTLPAAAWRICTRTPLPLPVIWVPNRIVYVPTCRFVPPPAFGSSYSVRLVALTTTAAVSSSSIVTVTFSAACAA